MSWKEILGISLLFAAVFGFIIGMIYVGSHRSIEPIPEPEPEPEPEPIPEPPHVHEPDRTTHNSTIAKKYTNDWYMITSVDPPMGIWMTDYYIKLEDGHRMEISLTTYRKVEIGDHVLIWESQEDCLWWHRWREHGQITREGVVIREW